MNTVCCARWNPSHWLNPNALRIAISDRPRGRSQRDFAIVERARAELAAVETVPAIEEVRAALPAIPGSLSKDVIAERGDY